MKMSRYYICLCDDNCKKKQNGNSFEKSCRCFHHRAITSRVRTTGMVSMSVDVLPPRSEFSYYPSKKRPR